MKSIETHIGRVIVGRVFPDEELIDSLKEMVKKHEINAGLINVIGAFKKITIGFFNLESNEYQFKTFNKDVELVSCMGNVAWKDGEPIIHVHVTIGMEDYGIIGGHLSQPSIISVTGEVYIYEIEQKMNRAVDSLTGLSLLDFK